MICRSYFPYSDEIAKLHFKYDFCPTECVSSGKVSIDPNRFEFCNECPKKKNRESFRRKYEAAATEHLPGRKFPFDEMLSLLYIIRTLEDKTEPTVKDADFLAVYLQSQNSFEKEKDWNERKKK